jgi:hypothetical protein
MNAVRLQLVRLLLCLERVILKTIKAYDDGSLFNGKIEEKEHRG